MQVVPDSEVFVRKRMISPDMLCSVFDQTPPSLAPEELYLTGRFSLSPEEAAEKIAACMSEAYKIDGLRDRYSSYCLSLFEDAESRACFDCLPNKKLRFEYVKKKHYDEFGFYL